MGQIFELVVGVDNPFGPFLADFFWQILKSIELPPSLPAFSPTTAAPYHAGGGYFGASTPRPVPRATPLPLLSTPAPFHHHHHHVAHAVSPIPVLHHGSPRPVVHHYHEPYGRVVVPHHEAVYHHVHHHEGEPRPPPPRHEPEAFNRPVRLKPDLAKTTYVYQNLGRGDDMTSFAFNVSDGDVDHFHVNGEPVVVDGEEVEVGDFVGEIDGNEARGRLTQRRRRPPPPPPPGRSRQRQRQRQRVRPQRPQSEEENKSLRLKDSVGETLNELFGDASPIKIGFDRKFLVPNFQPLKFRSTTTAPSTTTRKTTTRRPRIASSTVARAPTTTADSTTAAVLNFEPKRTNRRRSTTTPSPASVETDAPYSTKAKSPTTTTPLPFVESQTAAPLRIVQSSSYVVVNGSHRNVDHSNSLGGEDERNYYPAQKEGRNYDKKEELLEELIELLSESIQHRHKDKASWNFLHVNCFVFII